jgi:hypothetical protein
LRYIIDPYSFSPSGSDTTVKLDGSKCALAPFLTTPAKPQTFSQPSASADARHDTRLAPDPWKNTDPAARVHAVKLADDSPAEEHIGGRDLAPLADSGRA